VGRVGALSYSEVPSDVSDVSNNDVLLSPRGEAGRWDTTGGCDRRGTTTTEGWDPLLVRRDDQQCVSLDAPGPPINLTMGQPPPTILRAATLQGNLDGRCKTPAGVPYWTR